MAIFDNELIDNKSGGGLEDNSTPRPSQLATPGQRTVDAPNFDNFGFQDAGKTGLSIEQLSQVAKTPNKMGTWEGPTQMVPRSELMENSRYPVYERGVDLENIYGLQQGAFSQIANGVVKMGATMGGTFAQSLSNIPNVISSLKNGPKDLSGNPDGYEGTIDNWLKNLEDKFPNYYTKQEREHPYLAMLPFAPGNANFWGDKVIKNLGFTGGAIAGAAVQDLALGMITEGLGEIPLLANQIGKASLWLNKLFTGTNDLEKVLAATKYSTATEFLGAKNLAELAASTKVANGFKYGAGLIGSSMTEAGVEARDGYRQVKQELINQYKLDNAGVEPTGDAAKQIEEYATDAMNARFGINMALLTVSNAIQFDNLFKSFGNAGKSLTGGLTRDLEEAGKLGLKEGSLDVFEKKTAAGISGKIWESVRPKLANVLAEGVYEEGGQYAAERGTYDYYTRKYKNPARKENEDNWNTLNETLKSTTKGLADQFGTSEGLENMLIGGLTAIITGGIMGKVDSVKGQGKDARLQSSINILNQYGLTGILSNKYDNTLNSIGIAKDMENAAKSGDIFAYKNLQSNMFFNFVQSRIPAGMHDVTIEQLKMLKDLSKEDFEKTFGMDFNSSNKTTVDTYVDGLITEANNIKTTTDAIDSTFKNPFTRTIDPKTPEETLEGNNYSIFEDWKTNLVRYASVATNVNNRLNSIQQSVEKINPLVDTALLGKITDPESLRELSKSYEEQANQLDKTITEYTSPSDKRATVAQIKALRNQSEKINLALANKAFDLKGFNDLLNFELNNQDPTKDKVVGLESSTELHNYGGDINKLNGLKKRAGDIFDALSTEDGFNKFFKQAEEIASKEVTPETAPVEPSAFQFTNKGGVKEDVQVGREYQVPASKKASVQKIADDRYQVTTPDGNLTFFKTEEKANAEAEDLNKDLEDLAKVKVLGTNADSTVKVEDAAGNIQNINLDKLAGYEKIQSEQEKLQKFSEEIDKEQEDIENKSGDVATVDSSTPIKINEGKLKDVSILFESTTSAEEGENFIPKPHELRPIEFLNNVESFPNKANIKTILVTPNQLEALGLGGLAAVAYNVSEEEATTDTFKEKINNLEDGLVAAVYVEQDGTDVYFVNKDGKRISKLGEKADLQQVVFSTMPTTSLQNTRGNRFRAGQEEEAKAKQTGWKAKRAELFNAPVDSYTVYNFTVSSGIPIENYGERNVIGGTLIPKDKISTQEGLLQISSTGVVFHQGKQIKVPVGRPFLQNGSVLQPLVGRTFSANQAKGVYEVIKLLAADVKKQADAGKPVRINRLYSSYLQNVLYWKSKSEAVGANQIYINTKQMNLILGGVAYDFTDIANKEEQMVEQLMNIYQNINKETLTKSFHETFFEPHMFEGNLVVSEWKNYQTYLLADENPDGSARSMRDVPLTTNVVKTNAQVPYNFIQKYAVLEGMELPVQTVAPKVQKSTPTQVNADEVGGYRLDGTTENIYQLSGDRAITFTATQDTDNKLAITVNVNDVVKSIAENKDTLTQIIGALKANNEFNASKSNEQIVTQYIANRIAAEIQVKQAEVKATEVVEPEVKEGPKPENFEETGTPDNSEYRAAAPGEQGNMTDAEVQLFKAWHAENVPNLPYEVLEQMVTMHNGAPAFGVYENGVVKFYKGALKGTEYHEAFHGIFKGFLSLEKQQALYDEFRNRSGSFKDRESGKTINFDVATDRQIRDRMADEFAEFKAGKIAAKTLGQKLVNLFRNIINFVKTFGSKPSLKEELFKAIETGKFKSATYAPHVINEAAEYRSVEGLTEKQTNEFVQDIAARVFRNIFGTNTSLYNPEALTAPEVFDSVKAQYAKEGKLELLGEDKWNQLVVKTKDLLRTFKIEFDADNTLTINDENVSNRTYAPEPFSTDWKKTSSFPVKLLIGTLTESEVTNQDNPTTLSLPRQALSSVNGLKLLNFSRAFATVIDKLANTTKVTAMVDKLTDLARNDANYVKLFTRLKGDRSTMVIDFSKFEPHDWRLFVNFYQTFTKQKPEALVQYVNGDEIYTSPANLLTVIKQTQQSWIENIKAYSEDPSSIIKLDKPNKVYKVNSVSGISIKTPSDMIDFLNKLGVNYTLENYLRLKPNQQNRFADAVASIHTFLGQNKTIASISGKTLGINGPLTTLAELLVKTTNPLQESTFANVEGEMTQAFSDTNAPSLFENEFNEADTLDELIAARPELKDVFSANSITLKKGGLFYDKDGKKFKSMKVSYIGGTKDVNTNEGISTANLTLGDRFTQEINQNLNGNYYILIPADSSTEWMINLGNNIKFMEVEGGLAYNKIYTIFKGYLKDDFAIAMDDRSQLANTAPRAKELRFFNEILSDKLLAQANTLIINNSTNEAIDKFMKDNEEAINNSVKVYIEDNVAATRKVLEQTNKIAQVSEGVYKYDGLDNTFTSNQKLNKKSLTSDDIDNVLTFANANYIINNIEMHKVLFGDPYQFKIKDNQLDETKRIKSFLSPRRVTVDFAEFNTSLNQNYNKVGELILEETDPGYHLFKPYVNTITFKDVEIMGSLLGKTNEADAASWIMDGTYREVKLKNGQWSDEAEAWHQWQMANTRNEFANKGIYTYTNTSLQKKDIQILSASKPLFVTDILKPIVTGNKYNKSNFDQVLDKFSQMPIYYDMVKGTNLEKLYIKMWKENIGYAIMESGRKVGAENLHSLYNADGSFNDTPFTNAIQVAWKSYGIQVENSYEGEKSQTRGSQLTKLASVDLFDNGVASSPEAAAEYAHYNTVLNALGLEKYSQLLDSLGLEDLGDGFKLIDNASIAQTLEREMLRREVSDNVKDTIQLDDNGQFRIPFEASPAYLQIRNILYSMVNKAIISPKMNGGGYVQAPVTGWEDASKGRKVIEINGKKVLTDDTLKFYTKEQPWCEVLLPHWFKDQFSKAGFKSDEELLAYLNKPENESILRGIGFRIPTQGLSSVEVFKVKGFLDQSMGHTVIVPSEITTKAGSDFDIDKLNMYLKNTYINAKGQLKIVPYFGTGVEAKEAIKKFILKEDLESILDINSRTVAATEDDYNTLADRLYLQSLENEYYNSIANLISLPENFERLITPVGDAGLKGISNKLDELRGVDESKDFKNRMLNRNYLTSLRNAFITAKKWVGIAAVNITNHSLSQKTQIYIDPARIAVLDKYQRLQLGDGTIILEHNKTMVDGKEVISLSGVKTANGKEYISDNLSGYATSFVDVAKDPYILKIIGSNLVVSTFMFLQRAGVSTEQVAMFMNQPIIKDYLTYLDSINSKSVFNKKNKAAILDKFPANKYDLYKVKVTPANFEKNITDHATGKLTSLQNAEQHKVLQEFLKYYAMSQYLFKLSQATNYDTTKFKSGDAFAKKQIRTQVANDSNIFSSAQAILDNSFIGEQTNLLDKSMEGMGKILKLESPEFAIITKKVLAPYSGNEYLSADKFDTIATKIKASFLDYIIQTKTGLNAEIKTLLVDADTAVAGRLATAKKNHPELAILNELVQSSSNRVGGAKTIKLKANIKDAYDENLYTGYMRELRDNPDTRDLYYDIVMLSILQGTYQSASSIKNIIPIEDYSAVLSNVMSTLKANDNLEAFTQSMFQRNNWQDDDIFKTIQLNLSYYNEGMNGKGEMITDAVFEEFPQFGELSTGMERKLLALNQYTHFMNLSSDFVKVPRVVTIGRDRFDLLTGRLVTNKDYAERKAKGDTSLNDVIGYQRVKYADGSPVTRTSIEGAPEHIYKMINLLGDGQFAAEHYSSIQPSVINNGTVKIEQELSDGEIIRYLKPNIDEKLVPSQEEPKEVKPEDLPAIKDNNQNNCG